MLGTISELNLADTKWSRTVQNARRSNKSLKTKYFNLPKKGLGVNQKEILLAPRRHLARHAESLLKSFISTCRRVDGLFKTIKLWVLRWLGEGGIGSKLSPKFGFVVFTGCGIPIALGNPYIWYSLTLNILTTATGPQRGCSLCFTHQTKYSRTPLIRTLVIRISNYPDLLGPSVKHFLTVIVLHFLWFKFFSHLSNTYKELGINVLFIRK